MPLPPHLAASSSIDSAWLFLSPHLDDAVLSCGALIAEFAPRRPITVATMFTAAGPAPHTLAAWSFMRQCAASDAATLFEDRRAEDRDVIREIGADPVHLGETDALYRRRSVPESVERLGARVPELVHRYPTFRFDIAKGRVSRGDRTLIRQLRARVAELISQTASELVFCPVGVGRHVDHLITRAVGDVAGERTIYYSDFPYNQVAQADQAFLTRRDLMPWTWDDGIGAKERLIRGYRTQADALFPAGHVPAAAEVYYCRRRHMLG
ncbi:PIG-L deacetylase family protein [Pseudonocardia sp. CA-142604]|uniref:PIG-L deacetylase family protein n=1 Tax=Pseudonocardia sp. CA-142604 TaxID=3240024 RepID=UPI003D8D009B